MIDICDKNEAINAQKEKSFIRTDLSPLRKVIAARMVAAKQDIPHFRLVKDIKMDAALDLREKINSDTSRVKISINDFVIKACSLALIEWPEINSQFFDDHIHQFLEADISIVVTVPGGLLTPVLRGANDKSLQAIASELSNLIFRASKGQLKMPEINGGSFTVSNLGMYGVDQFDAIINPPQVAILALGRAKNRAVVSGGKIISSSIMRVSLSLDHRAVDGVTAAGFLTTLASFIENPECLLA